MFCLRRAAARALSNPSAALCFQKPRSITTLTSSSLRTLRPVFALPSQRRFASDVPSERHPALEDEPAEPQATSAEPFDISEVQPTDGRDGPQQESTSASEQYDAEVVKSAEAAAEQAALPTSGNQQAFSAARDQRSGETFDSGPATGGFATRAQAPTQPGKNLYIGNLFFDVTEEDLRREFSKHGTVSSTKIIYDSRGLSKGFGYVDFLNTEDATAALQALDRQVFEGRRMSVQYATPRGGVGGSFERRTPVKNDPSKTLFIGNMSFELSDQDLNELFRDVKNVLDVRVAIDRRTGQPRGFAHADFTDVQSAELAREKLEGKELYGRRLRIDFSTPSARVRAVH